MASLSLPIDSLKCIAGKGNTWRHESCSFFSLQSYYGRINLAVVYIIALDCRLAELALTLCASYREREREGLKKPLHTSLPFASIGHKNVKKMENSCEIEHIAALLPFFFLKGKKMTLLSMRHICLLRSCDGFQLVLFGKKRYGITCIRAIIQYLLLLLLYLQWVPPIKAAQRRKGFCSGLRKRESKRTRGSGRINSALGVWVIYI